MDELVKVSNQYLNGEISSTLYQAVLLGILRNMTAKDQMDCIARLLSEDMGLVKDAR